MSRNGSKSPTYKFLLIFRTALKFENILIDFKGIISDSDGRKELSPSKTPVAFNTIWVQDPDRQYWSSQYQNKLKFKCVVQVLPRIVCNLYIPAACSSSSIELSHGKWVSTCGVTSHLNFAPDWNWDKFARIAYTGSTRYSFISFSGFFRTGINVLKTMPISFWWLVWGLCLWTTTNYVKNYLNFILLSFGTKKEHVPDTEVSFISGSVRYTGPKTFADEKLPSISEKFMISYRRAAIEKKLPQNVFNGQ